MTVILNSHCLHGGLAEKQADRWKLSIPAGPAFPYRVAQLEDYTGLSRRRFPSRPPRTFGLRARASSGFAAGTWGFGFWNDPFGPSINPLRLLPAMPNAAWFFFASNHNYLSFRDDKPAQGFLAQAFSAPGFDARLVPAAFTLPFSRQAARRRLSGVIDEDAVAVSVDPTDWHAYRLRWSPTRCTFEVDGSVVLETSFSPRPPMGLVIWIDNQFASFTPDGRLSIGLLKSDEPAWLEAEDVELTD
ncbi:MAG TPA: hypothetical protein VGJ22_04525 [Anaerolineales bacterium]|jgi:hypothetical protein